MEKSKANKKKTKLELRDQKVSDETLLIKRVSQSFCPFGMTR